MIKKDADKIIRQRVAPNLFDYCYITTSRHLKNFLSFRDLLAKENRPLMILDLGCGYKPFQKILKEVPIEKYIGVDFDRKRSAADVEAAIDDLPFEDSIFDAAILSEVLEHVPSIDKAVTELRRVTKNGALVYLSTPFLLGEHGTPYDFQRITQYKYLDLFKNDEILLLRGTNTSLAAPFLINNVVLENIAVLKFIPFLPQFLYFCNNILALLGELTVDVVNATIQTIFYHHKQKITDIFNMYFRTMPGGYDVIVKIRK